MINPIFGKADLHIHSFYSNDAFSSVKEILKKAKEQKLDLIAFTDHDTIVGAKEAKKIASQFGLEVIIGEEITTKEGDLIALFIEELILPHKGILDTIKEIRQQGGLAIIPHPANWLLGGISLPVLTQIFTQVDGIEFLNGSWAGRIKQKKVQELNNQLFNLAPLGSSDAHHLRHIGKVYTSFPGTTAEDLYQAIKNKMTLPVGPDGSSWSTRDKFSWMINSPRILIREPFFPLRLSYRVIKKLFF